MSQSPEVRSFIVIQSVPEPLRRHHGYYVAATDISHQHDIGVVTSVYAEQMQQDPRPWPLARHSLVDGT